jgi:hypothetical protein
VIGDYTPSVDELASLIPSRAAGRFTGGAGAPTFPDTDRVEAVIQDATGLIAPSLGGDGLDRTFWTGAKALIKLQAALLLEPSAWPEQTRPEKSVFAEWVDMLNVRMEALTKAIIRFRDDGDSGEGSSQKVIGGFPPSGISRPTPTVTVNILGELQELPGQSDPNPEGLFFGPLEDW